MSHLALLTFAFWALLLGPGLCVGGVVEHLCAGCPEEEASDCSHEEVCSEDPCSDEVLRPDAPLLGRDVLSSALLPSPDQFVTRPSPDDARTFDDPVSSPPDGLPYPESDRPSLR